MAGDQGRDRAEIARVAGVERQVVTNWLAASKNRPPAGAGGLGVSENGQVAMELEKGFGWALAVCLGCLTSSKTSLLIFGYVSLGYFMKIPPHRSSYRARS